MKTIVENIKQWFCYCQTEHKTIPSKG